jgi:hypothetical protein
MTTPTTWETFVKPLHATEGEKRHHFRNAQEAAKKDVERALRILQAQFAIVRGLARFWKQEILSIHHEYLCDHA